MERSSADLAPPLRRYTPVEESSVYLTALVAGQIEDALRRVGDYGEVRLIVNKSRLRFIQIVRSESVEEA